MGFFWLGILRIRERQISGFGIELGWSGKAEIFVLNFLCDDIVCLCYGCMNFKNFAGKYFGENGNFRAFLAFI